MILRIEFSKPKSSSYAWAVRLCKKFPSYKEEIEDGLLVHSVEIAWKDYDAFEVLAQRIAGWKNSAFFLDGKLTSMGSIAQLRFREEYQRQRADMKLMDQIDQLHRPENN